MILSIQGIAPHFGQTKVLKVPRSGELPPEVAPDSTYFGQPGLFPWSPRRVYVLDTNPPKGAPTGTPSSAALFDKAMKRGAETDNFTAARKLGQQFMVEAEGRLRVGARNTLRTAGRMINSAIRSINQRFFGAPKPKLGGAPHQFPG